MVDFKISSIIETNDKKIVTFRIYQGAITTENEPDEKGNLIPITGRVI